ncbi:MAG TPA: cysteine--tRNA ligase [Candidatus Paceibacterota bacterium]
MNIYLHNTLTGKKELFTPIKKGAVGIYQCGPTVYDTVHIGNLRTSVLYDIVRRVFEFNDYTVTQVMNITDVDDKTIRRSSEENVALSILTQKYEKLFLDDVAVLHIKPPHILLRATEAIPEIIALIETLLKKGFAYKADDGIYFSIKKSKGYGVLARLSVESHTEERIHNDEYDKEHPRDFALWKFSESGDEKVVWEAPFGKGRPGWHIECSAMSIKALGHTIDIHMGGADLIFPHHTNEIAQSEAATGELFVHYWLHGGMVNVNDDKMAKSKKNFLKRVDLEEQGISPVAYRYWLLSAHYRTQVNVTLEALQAAQTALTKLLRHFMDFENGGSADARYIEQFNTLINDDVDMPKALALTWELVKSKTVKPEDKKATLLEFDKVLGLDLAALAAAEIQEPTPPEITALAEEREVARKEKDWQKADALRNELLSRGYDVKDTEKGFELKKVT